MTFNGGDSRDIVLLEFMKELYQALDLPYSIQEYFDYIIGTSLDKKLL